jgi:L-threonylcarbamoyladenylate synthase
MALLRGDDPAAVAAAARRLADGGLVAFPTETVYGLGARADRDDAVQAIFDAKGRPADHPLIVHVASSAAALEFARSLDAAAQRLIEAFWPGPVTVIVARRPDRAQRAAGGLPTIALRSPAHPVARALLTRCAELGVAGLAAPSANRFGRVSPTRAEHVADEFGPDLLLLDGGACPLGIESTIVDCSRGDPVLLRPGTLARAAIEQVLGRPLAAPDAGSARAPGTLARHYAPRTRLRLVDRAALATALADAAKTGNRLAVYSRERPAPFADVEDRVRWQRMPPDPAAAAHELFAVLRDLDRCGADQIWVELPPDEPSWDGVRDRLRRAAAC